VGLLVEGWVPEGLEPPPVGWWPPVGFFPPPPLTSLRALRSFTTILCWCCLLSFFIGRLVFVIGF